MKILGKTKLSDGKALGIWVSSIFLVVAIVVPFLTYALVHLPIVHSWVVMDQKHFGEGAAWSQVAIAFFTLLCAGFALAPLLFFAKQAKLLAVQTKSMAEQARFQRRQIERETYRVLISPEMQCAKRLVSMPQSKREIKRIEERLAKNPKPSKLELENIIETMRKRFDSIGKSGYWPLLAENRIGFDHVESLLSEYNYLAMLIESKDITAKSITSMAKVNLVRLHKELLPLILLRRELSGKQYAEHFSKLAVKWSKRKSKLDLSVAP